MHIASFITYLLVIFATYKKQLSPLQLFQLFCFHCLASRRLVNTMHFLRFLDRGDKYQ